MKIGKEDFMRQAEKNTTAQEKIISAATREFAAHGFEAASMNVICKDGGISKGNLYHYFPSKEALYLSCVKKSLDGLTSAISKGLEESSENADNIIDIYFDSRIKFFRQNQDLGLLFCRCMAVPDKKIRDKVILLRRKLDKLNMEVVI